jgi:hypothetical protein
VHRIEIVKNWASGSEEELRGLAQFSLFRSACPSKGGKMVKLPEVLPHRVVDSIADGLVGGVDGFGNAVVGAVKGVGKAVMGGLDKPFAAIAGGREGPHRIVDRAADGAVNAVANFASTGVIGSVRTVGKGVMSALDHPWEQITR